MPAPNFCPKCGLNMGLVDRVHRCVPRRRVGIETEPEVRPVVGIPITALESAPVIELKSNIPTVVKVKRKRAPNGTFDRKKYQRELMRKRRKEGKA